MWDVNNFFCIFSAFYPGKFRLRILSAGEKGAFVLAYPLQDCRRLFGVMSVKKPRYFLWIAVTEGVGILSGFLSRRGTELYAKTADKPPLSPPGWVFPVVWSILFALMGIGAARVEAAPDSRDRTRGMNLFVAQLVVNVFWSLIFFNARAYGFSLVWLLLLWALILLMILTFRKVDTAAAWLQIPYLLWVTFAAYLNYGVWVRNR